MNPARRSIERKTVWRSIVGRGSSVSRYIEKIRESRLVDPRWKGTDRGSGGVRGDADGSLSDRGPINPVQQQSNVSPTTDFTTAAASPADVTYRRRRLRGLFFSHPIRSRKSDQAGIDGVGEHCGQHRVP